VRVIIKDAEVAGADVVVAATQQSASLLGFRSPFASDGLSGQFTGAAVAQGHRGYVDFHPQFLKLPKCPGAIDFDVIRVRSQGQHGFCFHAQFSPFATALELERSYNLSSCLMR
jgi:hypothetical protein